MDQNIINLTNGSRGTAILYLHLSPLQLLDAVVPLNTHNV